MKSRNHLKQVFTSADRVYIYHLKNLLEAEGIQCVIKNDQLTSLAGELPMTICWPELWIVNHFYTEKAKRIIACAGDDSHACEQQGDPIWVCEICGEKHAAQFTDCWNCQNIENNEDIDFKKDTTVLKEF